MLTHNPPESRHAEEEDRNQMNPSEKKYIPYRTSVARANHNIRHRTTHELHNT